MTKPDADRIGELLDRTKRIETRLVKVGEKLGVETRAQKPVWDNPPTGIHIPSLDTRLGDILAIMNPEENPPIYHQGRLLGWFDKA